MRRYRALIKQDFRQQHLGVLISCGGTMMVFGRYSDTVLAKARKKLAREIATREAIQVGN